MNKNNGFGKTICLATICSLMALLSGCGGGDDKKKTDNSNNCFDNPVYFILCVIAPSSDSSGTNAKATKSGVAANLDQIDEYEPNNVLNNANIVSMPLAITDAAHGLRLEGSVRTDDASDFFIFTPTRTGTHTILLCGDTCDAGVEDDAAYIMIYDQNQTTIASTPIGTVANQEIAADLTAGFAYYVEVNGYNVGAIDYDYRLAVVN